MKFQNATPFTIILFKQTFSNYSLYSVLKKVTSWPVSRERLAIEQKEVKFWNYVEVVIFIYGAHLTFQFLMSFWGHSMHLSQSGLQRKNG